MTRTPGQSCGGRGGSMGYRHISRFGGRARPCRQRRFTYPRHPVRRPGDVTGTQIAWKGTDGLPSIASPVTDGRRVLLCEGGEFTCYDVKSGAVRWKAEAGRGNSASPVIAGPNAYVFDQTGKVFVMKLDDVYRPVSEADLHDTITATPAFVDGRIYVRTKKSVFCCGLAEGAR